MRCHVFGHDRADSAHVLGAQARRQAAVRVCAAGYRAERPPRQVTIYRIELLSLSGTQAEIDVACSKGTYIRTLAQDIGRALGCYAHLAALRRTHVGPFSLDRAVTLDALQAMPDPKQALLALNELPEGLLPSKTLKDSL